MSLLSAVGRVRHLATSRESKVHFGLPGTPLGKSRQMLHESKENSMLVKRIAACIPTYLQPFPSNSTRKFKSLPY